jgi:hypothetical protein
MCQLKMDIPKIVRECPSHQAFHVLKNERLWPKLADSANGFREHVTLIPMASVFASQRKGLAGRTPGDHDNVSQVEIVEFPHITLIERPLFDRAKAATLVFAKCLASIWIPFNDGGMLEPGVRHAQCEAADASEKLDAIHRGTF